jgi:hypothetical protein
VIVLSKEFISKKYPMEELRLLLKRRADSGVDRPNVRLMPAFYGVAWEDVDKKAKLYRNPTDEMVTNTDPAIRALWPQWARDLDTLKRITGCRKDQVRIPRVSYNRPVQVDDVHDYCVALHTRVA